MKYKSILLHKTYTSLITQKNSTSTAKASRSVDMRKPGCPVYDSHRSTFMILVVHSVMNPRTAWVTIVGKKEVKPIIMVMMVHALLDRAHVGTGADWTSRSVNVWHIFWKRRSWFPNSPPPNILTTWTYKLHASPRIQLSLSHLNHLCCQILSHVLVEKQTHHCLHYHLNCCRQTNRWQPCRLS